MRSVDICPGKTYGYRRSPTSREPFQRVKAIEKVATSRGKWRVRFLDDPYPGLEEYVRTGCIIAPWPKVKEIERHERRLDRVKELSDRQFPGSDHPLTEAVDVVFESTGEDIGVWTKGLFEGDADSVQRVADRAGAELNTFGVAFEHGDHLTAPFGTELELAQAFAAGEPLTVHLHVDLRQRKYEHEMMQPGNAHLEPLVNRWRAAWALARQWAGHDAAIEARDEEIKRLRELIHRHIWDIQFKYRDDDKLMGMAQRLETALEQR